MVRATVLVCATMFFVHPAQAADIFDRQTSAAVKQFLEKQKPLTELTLEASSKMKPLSSSVSSPCVLIRTDEGNHAKALVSWGLRKGAGKPVPVLLIERYVTYRQDRADLTAAHGKDVMLFPGFRFNFDIGQVVPEGQGGDVEFTEDSTLKGVGEARIVPLNGSQLPAPDASKKHDPAANEAVVAEDFAGTWKVNADGRWLGEWHLKMTEAGNATGTFVSDDSQNSYDLSGQTGSASHNLKLDIFLANAQMAVDAFLWTKDKSMMAGTVTLSGRKFGFFATRSVDEK